MNTKAVGILAGMVLCIVGTVAACFGGGDTAGTCVGVGAVTIVLSLF